MPRPTPIAATAAIACLGLGLAAAVALPQAQKAPPGAPAGMEGFPDLVGGLKATEGCLGVETAQTSSGKNVIFAWFKDKKSVLRWYYSDMHQQTMETFFGKGEHRKPLEDVPDDIGPLMVIASITFDPKPQFEESSLPISQIAIETYAPVSGGLFLGGRFAPDSLVVPQMQDYTPKHPAVSDRRSGRFFNEAAKM